ncbi:MAG: DNA polymerase ligase N-terminal domain-containing protein [bacterium]
MSLKKYEQKRKFNKTLEPSSASSRNKFSSKGKIKFSNKKTIFVIHKHHASHLHWDLRLEINDVLKSWAVPKEPPRTKVEKRLAIQVEDHPLSYATFKGTIPEGNYGAGKVEIWDNGIYKLIEKTNKKIEFELKGKKMKGNYVLIKTNYGNKPEKSWLWMKI